MVMWPTMEDCCNSGCVPCILDVKPARPSPCTQSPLRNCINPTKYRPFVLLRREHHTKSTFLLTFTCPLPHAADVNEVDESSFASGRISYKPGQYFLLRRHTTQTDRNFTRAYTPILQSENHHSFTILVKIYYPVGEMSQFLGRLRVGDECLWRGPYGEFDVDDWCYTKTRILCVAQGTGVAPIFSVISRLLPDDSFNGRIKLLLCCQSRDELILRQHLHELLAYWNFKCELFIGCISTDDISDAHSSTTEHIHIVDRRLLYKEIIHERRLQLEDFQQFALMLNSTSGGGIGEENGALVCGRERFTQEMVAALKLCGGFPEHSVFIFK